MWLDATARHHCLVARQAILEVAHAAAQRLEVGLGGAVLRLLRIERGTFGAQAFFAFDARPRGRPCRG